MARGCAFYCRHRGEPTYLALASACSPAPTTPTIEQRSKEAGKKQASREAGKQGSREAGKQGSREAGKQGSREAGKQGSREAGQGRGQGDSGDRRVALPSLRDARPGASVRASSAHANGQRAPAAESLGFKF